MRRRRGEPSMRETPGPLPLGKAKGPPARVGVLGQNSPWLRTWAPALIPVKPGLGPSIHGSRIFAPQSFPRPWLVLTSLSAAVHSNKKQSYITSFPGQPTSDVRHSLQFAMDIRPRFQMPTPAPPPDGAEWIGIGGTRLSLVCFVPHNWPRRWI
jgi:hypothetical protein